MIAKESLLAIAKPTEGQAKAGNYRMAHVRLHELDVTLETPKGRRRRPEWPPMGAHYGYVKGTRGNDGDHIDVFLGPNLKSELVVVVDQCDADGRFDEHKILLGFTNARDAIAAYRASYTPGWKVGRCTGMTIDQFKRWLEEGNQTEPLADQVSRYAAGWDPEKHPKGADGRWIENGRTAIKLTRSFFSDHPGTTLRDRIRRWAMGALKNRVFTNPHTGWEIAVNKTGIKKGAAQSTDSAICLQALPELIEHARLVKTKAPQDKEGVFNFHYLQAEASIDGEPHTVEIKVREDRRGKFHYSQHAMKKGPPQIPKSPGEPGKTREAGEPKIIIGPKRMEINRFAADATVDQYAARKGPRNSPGQLSLESEQLRSSKTQKKLDWITVHPNGRDDVGHPVLIDRESGTIHGGMGGKFNGKTLKDIGARKKEKVGATKPATIGQSDQIKKGMAVSGYYHNGVSGFDVRGTVQSVENDTAGGGFANAWVKLDDETAKKQGRETVAITLNGKGQVDDSRWSAKPEEESKSADGIQFEKLKNEDAKPGDQLGMFGEATRAPQKQAEFGKGGPAKQANLIDGLDAKRGQMSLIDEAGAPDDMVYGPGKPAGEDPSKMRNSITEALKSGAVNLAELSNVVGVPHGTGGDPLASPLNRALKAMVDDGTIEEVPTSSGFGMPSFQLANVSEPKVENEAGASGWESLPLAGRSGFEQNVLKPLRDQVAHLDDIKGRMGPRYSWEVATNRGVKPGDPHAGSQAAERWKQHATKAGFDGDTLLASHPEYSELVKRLDEHRGWGDEPTGGSQYSADAADDVEVEQYASRRLKSSPGQLAMFDTGTGTKFLRRPEKQQKLGFGESDSQGRRWITVHGKDGGKGHPVMIDGAGTIVKGPGALVGKSLGELSAKPKTKAESTKPKAESTKPEAQSAKPKPTTDGKAARGGKIKLNGREYHAKKIGSQWFYSVDPAEAGWSAASPGLAKRIADALGEPEEAPSKPQESPMPKTDQGEASTAKAKPEPKPEPQPAPKSEPQPKSETNPNGASGEFELKGDRTRHTSRIEDFGEKIGGARKDTAVPTGPRGERPALEKDDRPTWRKRYGIHQSATDGKWFIEDAKAKRSWAGNMFSSGSGQTKWDTEEEALRALTLTELARTHGVHKNNEGDWEIFRRVSDRKRPTIKGGFADREEAMKYMVQNANAILEHQTRIKTIHEALEQVDRVGHDYRDGKPAKPKAFQSEFGFRGVEFGNWNNSAERQHVLDHAYDSMHDLAAALNIPASGVSLNGELGLAFGARGKGLASAAAHYEPNYAAINLTKLSGAGALAHEWMHALDHHLGRLSGAASNERVENARGDKVFKGKDRRDFFVSHGHTRKLKDGYHEELRDAFEKLKDTIHHEDKEFTKDVEKQDSHHQRTEKRLHERLDAFRDKLAKDHSGDSYKPYRGAKRNLPLPEDKMKEVDEIISNIKSGEHGEEGFLSATSARGGLGPWVHKSLDRLNEIHKEHRGRNAYYKGSSGHSGDIMDLHWAIKAHRKSKEQLDEANKGTVHVSKVRSGFHNSAKAMDEGQVSDYWSTPHEMMARAFEAYVYDKVKASGEGHTNDFLAYEIHNRRPMFRLFGIKPYPEGEERTRINKAFDEFMDVYRKHVHGGEGHQPPGDREKYSATSTAVDRMMEEASVDQYRAAAPAKKSNIQAGSKSVIGKYGDEGRFVTIHGHPVFITTDGRINRGPRFLHGKQADAFKHATKEIRKPHNRRNDAGKFKPLTKLDQAIVEQVGDHPDDVAAMREYAGHAHRMLSQEAHEINADFRDLLAHFGYEGRSITGFLSAMRRYRDPAKIAHFDEMVEVARRDHPRLLAGAHGESVGKGDDEHALFERLRSGFAAIPAKHDSEVMELAEQMAGGSIGAHLEEFDDNKDGRIGSLVYESDDPFAEAVPFAAAWAEQAVEQLHAMAV